MVNTIKKTMLLIIVTSLVLASLSSMYLTATAEIASHTDATKHQNNSVLSMLFCVIVMVLVAENLSVENVKLFL
jgi:hypothetical protein